MKMKKETGQKPKVVYKTPNKTLYTILTAFLSTLLFVLVYKTTIEGKFDGIRWFALTFLTMIITGIIANGVARLITHNWASNFSFHNFSRTLLNTFFYTILITTGCIAYIFANFPLFSVALILFIIKLMTFVFSDFFVSKIK